MNSRLVEAGTLMSSLTQSMVLRSPTCVHGTENGEPVLYFGIINRIEIESGNGFSYNITFSDGKTVFVRIPK